MVVWQIFPGVLVRAVVFKHGAPCTFAEGEPRRFQRFLRVLDPASRISSFVMYVFVFQNLAHLTAITRRLEIAAPGIESGIVHRVVDVWIAL